MASVKLPKRITDAHGRPRAKCPTCGFMVEVAANGSFARHKRTDKEFGIFWDTCESTSTPAPDGYLAAWLKGQLDNEREGARRARVRAADETAHAEAREKRADELEKLLERASKSEGKSK